jgi:uncharacterized protein (TIGR04562 family)
MERPSFLSKYLFDWESMDVIVGGQSALDSKNFVKSLNDSSEVIDFLKGYGLDISDPVSRAELFGSFQEALQFIKRYFLKEGGADGLDLSIPNSIYMITDVEQLFLMATSQSKYEKSDRQWAEIVLKVMHTILHVDKDLRSNYFNVIQTQIFDRIYKHIYREDNKLQLGESDNAIELIDFEAKSKKTRESVVIKLLHKAENVAEELFDRVGVRFVTKNRFDVLRVVRFLIEQNVVIPHNIKPSRSVNTMVDLGMFKKRYQKTLRRAIRESLPEEKFLSLLEQEILNCSFGQSSEDERNTHRSSDYQSIQFTCRQLIRYKNPFISEFTEVRRLAKSFHEEKENELSKKILALDMSLISRDIRFFYPYEIQIVDEQAHITNTEGDASHQEYKKSQLQSAMKRLFAPLMETLGQSFPE